MGNGMLCFVYKQRIKVKTHVVYVGQDGLFVSPDTHIFIKQIHNNVSNACNTFNMTLTLHNLNCANLYRL